MTFCRPHLLGVLGLLLVCAVAVATGQWAERPRRNSGMARCIVNCAQCHDIIGSAFNHIKCSRDCVKRKDGFVPDCTNPATIRSYLNSNAVQLLSPSGKSIEKQLDSLLDV